MARYRLRTEHVTKDSVVLPAGTEVGDGTAYPWPDEPSIYMEGLDAEGKKRVNELHQRLYGRDADWGLHEEDKGVKAIQEAQNKDPDGDPVSEQQRREQAVASSQPEGPAPAPTSPRGQRG